MVMNFLRSMPKTKDIVASADLMDFILLVNKDSPDIFRRIAAEKEEIEALAGQAAADIELARQATEKAEKLKEEYDAAFEKLESDKSSFELTSKRILGTADDQKLDLDVREKVITEKEGQLNDAILDYKNDRDSLNEVIAGYRREADEAIAAASAREARAAAAEQRFNNKLASINNAAAKG